MAVINNHSSISLDANFQGKHTELLQYFFNQGLNIEISDDFAGLKTFLTSQSNDEYPYSFDESFDGVSDLEKQNSFVLYIKNGDEIIATYAAIEFDYDSFHSGMQEVFTGTYENVNVDEGHQFYSSCQWVKTSQRGKKFGMCLDHLKKNIIFDLLNGDVNFAIHKETFKDYHLNGLHYDESIHLATIPQGDVGGAGEEKDKVYNVCWIKKESWLNKLNDVRKLYNR